jgi:hypothetical protein
MEEIIYNFLFGDPNVQKAIAPLAVAAIASAAPGIIKSVGSLFGGGKRRREERRAAAELGRRKQAYESFQFNNPYANMQNTYEDLTVNTQAADFATQQQQQALASTLGTLQGAAGSSGIAALAQSLAQQQSANLQASSASIAQQEAAIKQAQAGEASRLQDLQAGGEMTKQEFELGRTETLLGMASERKMRATAARAQAKQDLVGGLAEAAGAAGDVLSGGVKKVSSITPRGIQKFNVPITGPSPNEISQGLRSALIKRQP